MSSTPQRATLRRTFAAVAFVACLGSAGTVVLTEPQTAPRRYSQDGLEIELPGDWQPVVEDSDPSYRRFRSAAIGGEITFIGWVPISAGGYLGSFERFIKDELPKVQGRRDVKRLRISGLDAVSFSAHDTFLGLEVRETWIGIPDRENHGEAFRFYTAVRPSNPEGEAELIAYERMLTSMRIDPVVFNRAVVQYSERQRRPVPDV